MTHCPYCGTMVDRLGYTSAKPRVYHGAPECRELAVTALQAQVAALTAERDALILAAVAPETPWNRDSVVAPPVGVE